MAPAAVCRFVGNSSARPLVTVMARPKLASLLHPDPVLHRFVPEGNVPVVGRALGIALIAMQVEEEESGEA